MQSKPTESQRELYQIIPPLSDDDYRRLKGDIEEVGVLESVKYDEDGNIIDGHHRVKACKELGITDWPREVLSGLSEQEKRTRARSLNLNRRHLTSAQKRELIQQQLEDTPEKSNREVARELGVSHHTVQSVKCEGGQIAHTPTNTVAPQKKKQIRAALKKEPRESNNAIAEAVGVHTDTVARHRRQMENAGELEQTSKATRQKFQTEKKALSIRDLANKGMHLDSICLEIGLSKDRVASIAREYQIHIPGYQRQASGFDANRFVEATVTKVHTYLTGLDALEGHTHELLDYQIDTWLEFIEESKDNLDRLHQLIKEAKEHGNTNS